VLATLLGESKDWQDMKKMLANNFIVRLRGFDKFGAKRLGYLSTKLMQETWLDPDLLAHKSGACS